MPHAEKPKASRVRAEKPKASSEGRFVPKFDCHKPFFKLHQINKHQKLLSLPSSFQNLYRGRSIPALIRFIIHHSSLVGLEGTRILKIYQNKNYATRNNFKKSMPHAEKSKASSRERSRRLLEYVPRSRRLRARGGSFQNLILSSTGYP